jgi:hypothetical protein
MMPGPTAQTTHPAAVYLHSSVMVSGMSRIVIESAGECWGRKYLLAIGFLVQGRREVHQQRVFLDKKGATPVF